MPADVHQFMCLSDNFGVLLHDRATGRTAAIDAPAAEPVEAALQATGWTLTDILVTHHHGDHTAGIAALKAKHRCRVIAPRAEIAKVPGADQGVGEGDAVAIGNLALQVLDTPGHTAGHISYWAPADKLVFVGDTLFSIGCGRVIEGTMEMMWASLDKLRRLPDDTRIYCGHEYTKANIRFALSIEPDNAALKARAAEVERQLAAGEATLPVTMAAEKAANPFLRADVAAVATHLGLAGQSPARVFAEIRERKNNF